MPRILYIQYTNPAGYPPLEHSSRILADAGWDVVFFGTGAPGTSKLQFAKHARIRTLLMPFFRPGWRQKVHYVLFCLWAFALAIQLRPHWVYVSDLFGCLPGLILKRLGFRVLYHEHDAPALPTSRFLRMLGAFRRQVARRCPCVLPNRQRAELFRGETGAPRVTVVWNCPRKNEVQPARARPLADKDLGLFYVGVVGPTMLPMTIIAALALAPVRLVVVGYEVVGAKGYTEELGRYAAELGVADRITFLGSLARPQFYRVAAHCDVGLVALPQESANVNIRHLAGASNKAFDYLACGLALLVTDRPEWRELAIDSGYGLACNPTEPTSMATALRWFAEHRLETWEMGERGRKRVEAEWNYETQFSPVSQVLDQGK